MQSIGFLVYFNLLPQFSMLEGYRTYLSLVLAMAPQVAKLFGYDLSHSFGQESSDLLNELVTVLGGLMAFYFRAKATVPGWLASKE